MPAPDGPSEEGRADRAGAGRWRQPWVAVLVVGTIANALYFVVPVGWSSPWYVATGVLCAAVMVARLPSLRSVRRIWALLAAGQAAIALGDALFLFGPQPAGHRSRPACCTSARTCSPGPGSSCCWCAPR